jgi:DNA invertase Pin-like site-specific DNA recombinase
MGAVGRAEHEATPERERKAIAQAKAQGRYKGRVPAARRKVAAIIGLMSEGVRPSEIAGRPGTRQDARLWGTLIA